MLSLSHRRKALNSKTTKKGSHILSYTDETIKKLQREYLRQWRAKNPDKVKAANRRYWEKKAAKLKVGDNHAENENH